MRRGMTVSKCHEEEEKEDIDLVHTARKVL